MEVIPGDLEGWEREVEKQQGEMSVGPTGTPGKDAGCQRSAREDRKASSLLAYT